MLAKELLLVTGLVVSGAVSLPIAQGAAPAILDRDLGSDITAAALEARAFGKKSKEPERLPQHKWANPMIPQSVNKAPQPKAKMPDMEAGWSKPKDSKKASGGKPPKYPKKKGSKRDVEEEAEEAPLEARAFGKKSKEPERLPQHKWANPMIPQSVNKAPKPKAKMPDMESGWSKPKASTSKPASGGKPPKYPKKKGSKRDVEKGEEAHLEARAFGKKNKEPERLPQHKWANPMIPQSVNKAPQPKAKMPDMEAGWSKPKGSTSKPASGGKPPKYPKKKGSKRDVEEEAEAAEYDQ